MTDWSHGYNVSMGYTFGFYREMAPDWIDFALAARGVVAPRQRSGDPFRFLELGSGQGFGLCLLAAANPQGEFVGVDFSPEHTAHATALASELGLANVRFVEGDFGTLGAAWPDDLGRFDYVALHGIYSWVPLAIRHSIVDILSAATNPGAAVYVSYNAMPGWVSTQPFQHLLRLHESEGLAKGIGAVEAGRALFEQMEAAGSGVTAALPALKARIESTRTKPAPYLVQEYLHENWHPLWCSKVMTELGQAKLSLAASATIAENLMPAILPAAFQDILKTRSDPKLREDVTDCLINQTFRRDLFVRGVRQRHVAQSVCAEDYRFWRAKPGPMPAEVTVSSGFGSVTLQRDSVAVLMDAIGEGNRTLGELARVPAIAADPSILNRKLLLLLHGGWLGCSRGEAEGAGRCAPVNRKVAALAGVGAPYRHLAAGNLRSAVAASESDLILLDLHAGDPAGFEAKAAAGLRQGLARLGRKLAREGKPLTDEEEVAEAQRQAGFFTEKTLPTWRRLGVVD